MNNGLKIPPDFEAIIHIPDYLIKKTRAEEAQKAKKTKAKKAAAEEKQFLEENRPRILEKAKSKKSESDKLLNQANKNK